MALGTRFRGSMLKKAAGAPVPIKRVIRRDGQFMCGVCRRTRATEGEAQACLDSCLAQYLQATPAINEVKDGEAKQFRCGFCKRVYGKRAEAQGCADACRSKTKQSVESERKVSPPRPAALAPAPVAPSSAAAAAAAAAEEERKFKSQAPKFGREHMHKFLRDGRKLVCRKCGKESPTMETVIACFDAHVAPPKAAKVEKAPPPPKPAKVEKAPPPPEPVAAPAPVKAKAPKLRDDATIFIRDGARYVCRTCSAKYFTRGDVVACFNGHGAAAPATA